jgi:hypothetical protein
VIPDASSSVKTVDCPERDDQPATAMAGSSETVSMMRLAHQAHQSRRDRLDRIAPP